MTPEKDKTPPRPIDELRREIDAIDLDLVARIDRRAALARAIGKAKMGEGRERFFDAARQKEVIERILGASTGEFPPEALRQVFAEIMSGCLAVERPSSVGYLGPESTFSHVAALREFGHSAELKPFKTIPEIFRAVDRGWTDYGVVPVENSTGGVIHLTLDSFIDYDLRIVSEVYLQIHQHLISRHPVAEIETIYSKAEPFMQCQEWLRENLPNAALVEVSATARGVEMARDNPRSAAIAGEQAARQYDMPMVAQNIEDMSDNTTRFLVIGKEEFRPTGHDKTSLMLSIVDRQGTLFDLLRPFHDRGINLTKIESRPTRRKAWDLVFFIDFEGHTADPNVRAALDEVQPLVRSMKIMGSYPRDVSSAPSARPAPAAD